MSSVWGNNLKLSIFGEAHGLTVGGTLHNFPAGIPINLDKIKLGLRLRQGNIYFTKARREEDRPKIISGITNGVTNGAPITVVFNNKDSFVTDAIPSVPRPSQADYCANIRYSGAADVNGGGHLSGRLTLPMVFFGMMCEDYLSGRGVRVASHIRAIGETEDAPFPEEIDSVLIDNLNSSTFPTIAPLARKKMVSLIESVKVTGDSIGGEIESAVTGLPAGLGSPIFDNIESRLSSILFAIPAVKGVAFGDGFGFAKSRGSKVNDPFIKTENGIKTATNCNGGLNGGISNGMPIRVTTVFKPTPSIAQPQETLDFETEKPVTLELKGKHVACLLPRASIIVTSAIAIGIADIYLEAVGYSKSL